MCILQWCMARWALGYPRVLEGKEAVAADSGSVFAQCNTATSSSTSLFAVVFDVPQS